MATSETKWTPGPWDAIDMNGEGIREVYLPALDIPGATRAMICEHITGTEEEAAANARLIAAAPDLYAALAEVLRVLASEDNDGLYDGAAGTDARIAAEAALARARGEAP